MNKKICHLVDKIVSMTEEGFDNNEISEKLNANVPAIRYWQKKLGLKSNPVVPELSEDVKSRILKLYNESKNALDVANKLDITQFRVLKYLNSMGVDTSQRFFKDSDAGEVFEKYKSGMTIVDIANFYGCERQAVTSLFKRFNFETRSQVEQSKLSWPKNRDAFTDFTEERTLFFYGLLLADGCISDKGSVSLTLQISDKHVIDAFKDYMQSDNKVIISPANNGNSQEKATFGFRDKEIANRLITLGMTPRKSLKEQLPSFDISDLDIARHFWRGYICGDGSVRSYPTRSGKMMPRLHVCGSQEICQGFANFCAKLLDKELKPKVYQSKDKRRTSQVYNFRLSGANARDVAVYLFDSAIVTINRKTEDVEKFKLYKSKYENK